MNSNLTIVILAAGLGTRMKSKKAKVLHEAGGATLIEHVVETALALTSPERIVVVVGHQADQVRAKLAGTGVRFAEQTTQRGTGDAMMTCREAVAGQEGQLVVLYGDGPLLKESTVRALVQHYDDTSADATVLTYVLDDPSGYGRMVKDQSGRVRAIVEHKVATPEQRAIREVNSGIYCFNSAKLWKYIDSIQPNPISNEYYLTDIVEIFNEAGLSVNAMLHPDSNELLGINTRVELALVDRIFRERKVTELMLSGVTIEKPETVIVDKHVRAGQDSVIEAFAQLRGNTVIGEECRIGSGAIIRDSTLADSVEIAPYTLIQGSVVETGATIGPFARLRQENVIEANAHIGNFVELKKTRLGAGAKAGHLAYLGDSSIGSKSNIGAGTITCNYDGKKKHRTQIGEGSFVGSNSTLVAPIAIGPGAYIAAGSVITDEVPQDALALGRSRQTNKDGWAKKKRETTS